MKKELSFLDNIEEEIILVNKELTILYANEAFFKRTGKRPQEVLGQKCFNFVHSEACAPSSHPCPAKMVFEKKSSYKAIHVHKDKNGNPIFVEIVASPIKEKDSITSAIEIMRDVTEKTMTERRLQEFIETSPDGIFTSDEDGNLTSVNPTFVKMTGYKDASKILGKPAAETVWAHSKAREEYISELKKHGFVRDREALLKKADGTYFYGSISSVLRKDASGKVVGLEGTLRDITPRKRAEDELIQRNRELALMANIASILNQSEKLELMLERCIEEMCKGFGMDAGCIFLLDEKKGDAQKVFHGFSLDFVEAMKKETSMGFFEDAPSVKDMFFVKDVAHDTRIKRTDLLRKENVVSFAFFPLQSGAKTEGRLFLASRKDMEWGKDKTQLLSSVTHFIGSAVQRISYMNQIKTISERLEKIVDEKSKKTKALLEAYYALQHTTNWQMGLKTIVECITGGFGFDNTYVFLINERKKILQCEAFLSSYGDLSNFEIPLDDEDYIAVQCVKQKVFLNIRNAFDDPRVRKQAGYAISAFAWIPIIFQNEILGAFSVDNKDSEKPITDEDIETLVLFANAAASFIEKTRMLFLPATEKKLSGKTKYNLAASEGYIVFEEKPEKASEIFVEAVTHGMQGFCATRVYPPKFRQKYSLTHTPLLWLSSTQTQESINPTDLGKLVHIITEFLHRAEDSIIFIEGLEYLITENDFLKMMKMLHSLMDEINISGSRLLLSINPRTLTEKEIGIMKKEFTVV